ncbi:hypothetical protein MMB17_22705 [Methylobacterium organophilum]|uniref:hypothetical protein n=1 Tax=Methylobacterium organophilum TaxID=410 RepID=UPI001F134FBB|nr:hypothetical protein [Methylobacterium organophilum]UMY17398.1 hypothetical protein MMB17_22705 [Methylobacterium organophilum]
MINLSRIALLTLTVAGGFFAAQLLATGSGQAADATAGSDATGIWSLRPQRSAPASEPSRELRLPRSVPLSALPGERRSVRVVYQGYGPTGSTARPAGD